MKDLSEHRLSSRLVYDGKLLKVHRDAVRLPDGSTAEREWIDHPGAVAVLQRREIGGRDAEPGGHRSQYRKHHDPQRPG